MARISQTVRSTARQGNFFPATVLDKGGGKVTVRLSGNGAIYRMLTLVGGPVSIGQIIRVDFSTNPPTAVAPGVEPQTVASSRTMIPPKRQPAPPIESGNSTKIRVYAGPPPDSGIPATLPKAEYDPTEAGLLSALSICVDDDAVYLPKCDITATTMISVPNITNPGSVSSQRISLIGVSRDESIIRTSSQYLLSTGSFASIRDLSLIAEANSAVSNAAVLGNGISNFRNVYLKATNAGTANSATVQTECSAKLRFYKCIIEGGDYGVTTNGDGDNASVDPIASIQAGYYHGVQPTPAATYQEVTGYGRWGVEFFDDSASLTQAGDYYYTGYVIGIALAPGKNRPSGYQIMIKAQYLNGTTSGDPLHVLEDQSTFVSLGGTWSYDFTMINSADEGPVEIINGVVDNLPYSNGDYIAWNWTSTTLSSDSNWIYFILSRHGTYASPGQAEIILFDEIYLHWSDGTREYIYPDQGHAYLEDCTITADTYDLAAGGSSLIEVNRCAYDKSKTAGNILEWTDGHPGILVSTGNLPRTTYPGMMVLTP